MIRNILPLFSILIVSVFLSLPLIKPGIYKIHDDQQVARLFVFDEALRAGQFPVRWVDGFGFGFGYPLFVFYPPFVYMMGETFHLIGFGFIDSVKIVYFLSTFLSGIAMYIFVKELWGRFPALMSSIFYLLVPYRAVDVYVRGALAESFSFVWLPLILWSFYKLFKTQKSIYSYVSAIFLALLIITHNLIFLPFMLILPFYLLFLILQSTEGKSVLHEPKLLAQRSLGVVESTVLAFGLSAFFWIPALLEKKFTIVDQLLLVNLANYQIHFVYPQQLWNWSWGFGGSAEGLADGISFKIGKLHIISSVAALTLALIHWYKNHQKNQLPTTNYQLPTFLFALFLLSAFMTTFYSKFIWDLLTPLAYLQFPWRFLIFTALFGSILAGTLIYLLRITLFRLIIGAIIITLLFIPNLHLFQPQKYRLDLTDEIATSDEVINLDVSRTSFEYLPKGVELIRDERGMNMVNLPINQVPNGKIIVLEGNVSVSNVRERPHKVSFQVGSDRGAKLQANLFNFPGWQVKIDQEIVKIEDKNRLKLINFNVPSGSHKVEIEFTDTKTRLLANLISLFSILALAFLFIKKWQIPIRN